ncbi:MAG: CCA tRNA nucleotidyltransferase [Phycisphaerales bacterium]
MARQADPAHARTAALAIVRRLRERGHTAYFAGGCVRDELLGLAPTDYDVATDATPDRIRALFKRTAEVGAAFGVILVTPTPEEGAPDLPRPERPTVEVATFRAEGPYSDRRRPDSVSFSDPKSDALRRDFTINALFLDPLSPGLPAPGSPATVTETPHGAVIDYVQGLPDLHTRILRAVGDPEARLAEDHLRALRAVRLAARLTLAIDPATASAIQRHARDLAGVSRERIGEEIRRMLAHDSRPRAITLLQQLSLDAPVLNEAPRPDSPLHLLTSSPLHSPSNALARHLASWSLDRALTPTPDAIRDLTRRWRAALCLSNDESSGLRAILLNLHLLEGPWPTLATAQQKRAIAAAGDHFLHALDLLTSRSPPAAATVRQRLADLTATPSGICPEPLLTGDDLVAMGLPPGPSYKKLLDRVYDAQLEDRIATPDAARELARSLRI